jgi:regulatory protein
MTEEFNIIYNKALDLLSRREHSKEEINQKLLIRFPSESVNIKLVIKKLSKNNIK